MDDLEAVQERIDIGELLDGGVEEFRERRERIREKEPWMWIPVVGGVQYMNWDTADRRIWEAAHSEMYTVTNLFMHMNTAYSAVVAGVYTASQYLPL